MSKEEITESELDETRIHCCPGPPSWLADSGSLQGHQLSGGRVGQCLHRTWARGTAKWAFFVPGHTVGAGALSLPLGGQETGRRRGCSFTPAQP